MEKKIDYFRCLVQLSSFCFKMKYKDQFQTFYEELGEGMDDEFLATIEKDDMNIQDEFLIRQLKL